MRNAAIAALALACLASTSAPASDAAGTNVAVPDLVTTTCQNCHGPKGNSSAGDVPRLNGQQAGYLTARLKSFHDVTQQTPHAINAMWDHSHLTDEVIGQLASYFSGQAPTSASGKGGLAALGKKLYENGAGEEMPACRSCHGAHGEGNGVVPRLAGQHGQYFTEQLEAFNTTLRSNTVMNNNTHEMTESQIKVVVAYLAAN